MQVIAAYILVCLIWGSTWLFIGLGLDSFPPFIGAGFRFTAASVIIFAVMKIKGYPLPFDATAKKLYLSMGFLSFLIPFGLVYWGEQFVPTGLASVLFGVYPFSLTILTFFFLKGEKIGVLKIIGLISGFTGIVVLFSDDFSSSINNEILGMLAIVVSGVLQSFIAVAIKKEGKHLHPVTMNVIPMTIAGVGLIIAGLFLEDVSTVTFDFNGLTSVLFLAFFGSFVSFSTYYWLLKRVNIVLLGMVAFITPIVALILGFIFKNEQLTPTNWLGVAIVLTGILVANLESAVATWKKQKGLKFNANN